MIKTLYELLSIIQDPVVLVYYDEVLSTYYDKLNIGRPTLKKKRSNGIIITKDSQKDYINIG